MVYIGLGVKDALVVVDYQQMLRVYIVVLHRLVRFNLKVPVFTSCLWRHVRLLLRLHLVLAIKLLVPQTAPRMGN